MLAAHHASFVANFEELIESLSQLFNHYQKVGVIIAKHLNSAMALFFADLFSVLDKSHVIGLVRNTASNVLFFVEEVEVVLMILFEADDMLHELDRSDRTFTCWKSAMPCSWSCV